MPLSLRRGAVTAIVEELADIVRLEVDGSACVAYPRVTGPVQVGDEVLVNVQARALELGSGGFDILYANLTRGVGLESEPGAHVMTLPYTPLQQAASYVEEEGPLAETLGGLPVVCCTLHSQVAPVCAALAGLRVLYVQVGGGALPVSLSNAVRLLRNRGPIEVSVAVAPCIDGDVQAVNVYSALAWCAAHAAEVVVCSIGPGIVGTATFLGHGGIAAVEAANATVALGGRAVLAPRVSSADERPRHRGLSHHTEAVLQLCAEPPLVPAGDELDAPGWRDACEGLPLSHMGRGPDEDPAFFAAAFAAGRLARELVT
jgi:hypothetical protein